MLKSFIHNSRVVFDALTSFLYAVNLQYGYDVKIVAVQLLTHLRTYTQAAVVARIDVDYKSQNISVNLS